MTEKARMIRTTIVVAFAMAFAVALTLGYPVFAGTEEEPGESFGAPAVEEPDVEEAGEEEPGEQVLSMEDAAITGIRNMVYTGKEITFPNLRISINGKVLTENVDYTIWYDDNIDPGVASIEITGIFPYEGTVTRSFRITPVGTTIERLAPLKKGMYVTWNAQPTWTTSYQVQYSTSSAFTTQKIISSIRPRAKITGLYANRVYYVRVRTVAKTSGGYVYSPWSKVMSVKTFDRDKLLPTYTGNGWYDIIIGDMVKKAGIKKNMTKGAKSKKAFTYLAKNFRYYYETTKKKKYHSNPSKKQQTAMEAKIRKLENQGKVAINDDYISWFEEKEGSTYIEYLVLNDSWRYHMGVCDDFAAIYTLMCNRVGIKAGLCGSNTHTWSWIKLGKKRYYVDPGKAIHKYYKTKKVKYAYFKMTKKKIKGYKMKECY